MRIQDIGACPIFAATSKLAERLVAAWNAFAARWNPVVVIVATCAVLTAPLVIWRGFHSDEGVALGVAKSAVEDGYWITPHLYGSRFVERPTLLSWIIAAASAPFGSVNEFTARFPIILFLLAGCLLIYLVLRRVSASVPAALLGVALFLACPIVIRGYVMPTADMPLAVLLFIAFFVWWDGYDRGRINAGRWAAIGGVLALAGLMKGPQPIGYFALGIGLFILITRDWKQIRGIVVAGIICIIPMAAWYGYVYAPGAEAQWASFMRMAAVAPLDNPIAGILHLISETMPAALFAIAFFVAWGSGVRDRLPAGFLKAIVCYASVAAIAVLFWPNGSTTRYFFPSILPMCVFGALGYDALAKRWPLSVAPGLLITLGLLAYAFIYSAIAAPLMPRQFRSAQIDAAKITAQAAAAPAPFIRTGSVGLNELILAPGPIVTMDMTALKTVAGPAWIAVDPGQAATLIAARPNKLRVVMRFGRDDEWRLLRLDK
jgi:4-amino-4-deoxy-L-arabinose transferase-like glycosyltransferase